MNKNDPTPLQSKKFVAAMIWNAAWLFLIATGIKSRLDPEAIIAMVYTAGATQVLYLGGQSAVDAFVRSTKHKYNVIRGNDARDID
jgi:hypothetical protein|tara:strand:+ start:318 stop:575 length:258 start_codon:yes stop_codon:yes gene_type:complete